MLGFHEGLRTARGSPSLQMATVAMILAVMTFPGADASAMAAGRGENVFVGLASSSLSSMTMCLQRLGMPGRRPQMHLPGVCLRLWKPLRLSGGGAPKKKVTKKGSAKGKKGGVEKPCGQKRKWWEGGSNDPAKGRLKFRHHFFKKTQGNAVKGCGTMPGTGGRQLLKPGSTRVLPDERPANRPKLLKWKGKCSGQAINKLGDKKQLIVRPNWSLWK